MDTYNSALMNTIAELLESGEITEEQIEDILSDTIQKGTPEFANSLLEVFKRNAPKMLREHRRLRKGFRIRNHRRWREGFDLLEMFIVISSELGEEIDDVGRDEAVNQEDWKFDALVSLHARAILVAREVLCLLTSGFPDGAMGRWRTLHEIAVVATFLALQDKEISERYLLHRQTQAFKGAEVYRKYEKRANLGPFGDEEFKTLKAVRDEVIRLHGPEMKQDWGWAYPVLKNGKSDKYKPTFSELEEHVELDHWRPRYKWASEDTHGNYRPNSKMLATSEAEFEMLLVGESNSGMTDPAHMMVISLMLVTAALVQHNPNLDQLVLLHVLQLLSDEIGETFVQCNDDSKARNDRRKTNRFRIWVHLLVSRL